MIAVSRCLIGENCTYAGKNNLCKEIKELYDQGLASRSLRWFTNS